MGLQTTDAELLTMNRVERMLRKLDAPARNRVANWVATREWGDKAEKPIPYELTGKAATKAAE